MMENWLLGYCRQCPDGHRTGRIDFLAPLRRNDDGEYVVDRVANKLIDEIGPSGFVFWPQSPAPLQDLTGSLVRFRTTKSSEYGDSSTTKAWLRVARNSVGWDVDRIGFRIVDQGPDLEWRQEPRWARGFLEGERLFIRQRDNSTLIGPWRIGREINGVSRTRELIPHPHPNRVFKYAINDLPRDCIYPKTPSNGPMSEMLLYAPNEARGQLVDLATPKQLAKWLVERIEANARHVVVRIEQEMPDWRTKLRNGIESNSESERDLHQLRWQRVETALNDMIFEADSVEKILKLEKFKSIIEEHAKTKVNERVAARVVEIEAEAQKKAKSTLERLERESQEVEGKLRSAKEELDRVAKEIQHRHDDAVARESAVRELESHIKDSRERLLKDLVLYQSLLPGVPTHPTSSSSPTAQSGPSIEPLPAVTPAGPPIADSAAFIDSRLWPSLARWHPGVPRILSVILHGTVCGSKAVLIPSPAWARAYADALGAFASLTILNVEPTWLGFGDLWRSGLRECWERASRDGSRIDLVLLRDVNRALPQCYARPLLDMIAGYRHTLPGAASCGWPNTLRLLACLAPPDESLPLTAEVVQHFAAVQRELPTLSNQRPNPLIEGHVTTETWWRWIQPALPVDPAQELVAVFGPLASAAASETASIAQVLREHGMGERDAKRTAHEARVEEPENYLPEQESGIGVAR